MKHSESLHTEILKLNPWQSYISPPNSARNDLCRMPPKLQRQKTIEQQYQKLSQLEHILLRQDWLRVLRCFEFWTQTLRQESRPEAIQCICFETGHRWKISSTLSFAQTWLLCGVRGVSERVAMGIDLRESKIISGGYQTRIRTYE